MNKTRKKVKKEKKEKRKAVRKAVSKTARKAKPARKVNKAKEEKKMEKTKLVYSKAKYINVSPRKARLVIDLIRGMNAQEAVVYLDFLRKSASLPIKKAVKSAIANAVNNFEMDKEQLLVEKAIVNDAPTFKRGRAGSRGRYKKILKRNCHIIIGLREID